MLTLFSKRMHGFCDGVSRREFMRIGALGIGGLTLADVFRSETAAVSGSSHKAIINIFLGGGPSHQDMFDLKPNAPIEFRGEFNPISTNAGFEICELFPRLATMADKFAVIRSITGKVNSHSSFQTMTGYTKRDLQNVGGRPALGSIVSRIQGGTQSGAPPFVSYMGGEPGYLGPVYKPFKPSGNNLRLSGSMTAERLTDRTELLKSLDKMKRAADSSGQMDAVDAFTQRAVGVVTSGRVADALDLKKEDPRVVERYSKQGERFLLARRLIEAGVRTVAFSWGGWDTHGQNFVKFRKQLPELDTALSALIEDLHNRGLDKDVTVVMWGEFGRTPRINKNAGRDHWNRASMCFLAGGGMNTGQVIGSTTKYAEEPKDNPKHLHEVFSTLYHNLGIDSRTQKIIDPNGRPQYLTDIREPIRELVG